MVLARCEAPSQQTAGQSTSLTDDHVMHIHIEELVKAAMSDNQLYHHATSVIETIERFVRTCIPVHPEVSAISNVDNTKHKYGSDSFAENQISKSIAGIDHVKDMIQTCIQFFDCISRVNESFPNCQKSLHDDIQIKNFVAVTNASLSASDSMEGEKNTYQPSSSNCRYLQFFGPPNVSEN
jgi:hypothetical protein